MTKSTKNELFAPALAQDTLNLIRKLNQERKSTFLIPTRFVSAENAQLAYLIDAYCNHQRQGNERKTYRSFCANSRYEALQGAIKLMRHNGHIRRTTGIWILDPEQETNFLINPLNQACEEDFLIPDLKIVTTFKALRESLNKSSSITGVILRNIGRGLSASDCSSLIEQLAEKNILTLWDDPDIDLQKEGLLHQFRRLPDIAIFGESLTEYQIPFALFCMSVETHKPWAKISTCLAHTSTYAGNKLAVTKARDVFLEKAPCIRESAEIKEVCLKIEKDPQAVFHYFAKHINPGMVKLYSLIGFDFICKNGHGSRLQIQTRHGRNKEILDVVSGGGAAIRGHSPIDILPEVLETYDPAIDYWNQLQEKLQSLFTLPYAFPAVSGATAVENAFILALMSNVEKKRIIVFKNNYAGKTLIALIGSNIPEDHAGFGPLYAHVTYIDPYANQAEPELISYLSKGDVALIWFEVFQGSTTIEIPENLLRTIQTYKEKSHYYIGIDEIMSGFYRIDKLSSYQGLPVQPDIVTFSKALSDGTFPMAVTLVSEKIYSGACQQNPARVSFLQELYKNQFGAHVALHCIEQLTSLHQVERIRSTSRILEKGMEQLQSNSPYLKRIHGRGHLYTFIYKNQFMGLYFCHKALSKENLFLYINRLVPALSISGQEAEEIVGRLKNILQKRQITTYIDFGLFLLNLLRKTVFSSKNA